MLAECSFSTSAYAVSIRVHSKKTEPFRRYGKDYVTFAEISIELTFHAVNDKWSFTSPLESYVLLEWNLVADYFEQHALKLLQQGWMESISDGLSLLDGSFTIEAGEGYAPASESKEVKGTFQLEFMINVGRLKPGEHPSYLGGQSTISTDEALRFAHELRTMVAELDESV